MTIKGVELRSVVTTASLDQPTKKQGSKKSTVAIVTLVALGVLAELHSSCISELMTNSGAKIAAVILGIASAVLSYKFGQLMESHRAGIQQNWTAEQ